ncbi:ribosome silencing factor RsfS/YbeB/iojap [Belnapia rosea]|uniref:Ribosomal silencing factor RsfS n=1 Tax=Belnapia rosea TaxID=938405 RepID=A0A1G6ZC05_9PROT|nr:ribosome silencing factor RsfS/YbeB/iojap [Belnapia rosea]
MAEREEAPRPARKPAARSRTAERDEAPPRGTARKPAPRSRTAERDEPPRAARKAAPAKRTPAQRAPARDEAPRTAARKPAPRTRAVAAAEAPRARPKPRAAARPAAKAPARRGTSVPEAKVIRRPVGVPPKPVPQEDASPRKRQVIAGPEAKPAGRLRAKEKATPDRLEQLVTAACASLEDDKAEDILVLDVTDRASFTDRMIIATGLADRQMQAMANHLEDALEKVGLKLRRDSIQGSDDWVLIDCGDLVIHLFKPEARTTYALERMWGPESPPGTPAAEGEGDSEASPPDDPAEA